MPPLKWECKLHTPMLLLHPNCNLTKIEYYFLLGEIIIASTLLPHTFAAPSKYIVHQSNFPSSTENTSSLRGTAWFSQKLLHTLIPNSEILLPWRYVLHLLNISMCGRQTLILSSFFCTTTMLDTRCGYLTTSRKSVFHCFSISTFTLIKTSEWILLNFSLTDLHPFTSSTLCTIISVSKPDISS